MKKIAAALGLALAICIGGGAALADEVEPFKRHEVRKIINDFADAGKTRAANQWRGVLALLFNGPGEAINPSALRRRAEAEGDRGLKWSRALRTYEENIADAVMNAMWGAGPKRKCGRADCTFTDRKPPGGVQSAFKHVARGSYGTYGYWLIEPERLRIHDWDMRTFVKARHDDGATAYLGPSSANNDIDDNDRASYSGNAAGLSWIRGTGAVPAGHFTADVRLDVTFGDSPAISGTINNFEGRAVNPEWQIDIPETGLESEGTVTIGSGGTVMGGRWSYALNPGLVRPRGVHGDFEVGFRDGEVVGAYMTSRDD